MGCDIHVYAEKKVNSDLSLKNLARIAIQKALKRMETKEMMQNQLNASSIPEELLEYLKEEPPGFWVHIHEDQVVRRDPNQVVPGFEPPLEIPSIYEYRISHLFSWLANVRGHCRDGAIAPHRGVPDDVSSSIKELYDWWAHDAHSGSWCTAQEVFDWPGWEKMFHDSDGNKKRRETHAGAALLKAIERAVADAREDPERVRIVFWFDS